MIDENLEKMWTVGSVRRAVKMLLKEDTMLFKHLRKQIGDNESLSSFLYNIVILGQKFAFSIHNELISQCYQYGYVKETSDGVKVSNRIFEAFLTEYFTSKIGIEESIKNPMIVSDSGGIIQNGHLNMDICLAKFSKHLQKNYNTKDEAFIEREGR